MPHSIADLSIQNYSRYCRRITRVVGERAGLRLMDFQDRLDMMRYKDIDRILPDEFMNTNISDGELIVEVRDGRPDSPRNDAQLLIGVAGCHAVIPPEVGELQ